MGDKKRLDKLLADQSIGTRSEVKSYIRKGRATVNGEVIKLPEYKVSDDDRVTFDEKELNHKKYVYYLLNKPSGIISASSDKHEKTVIDLIDSGRKDLFPVGRLDKDTEGLLLITNDGLLAHSLLSPKKHIGKTYYARIKGAVDSTDADKLDAGLMLDEEFTALPAKLTIQSTGDESEVLITIYEGKYHQVKRMFHKLGKEVIYLKRIKMGELMLPTGLKSGEYIEINREDIRF